MQDYYDKLQPQQPYTRTPDSVQSGMPCGFTGVMPVGMPSTYPCGMPIGMIPDMMSYMMPGDFSWQSFDAQQDPPPGMPPFGPPSGTPPFGPPSGSPPFGPPPGGASQGAGQPPGPPPSFTPSHAVQQQSVGVLSINPGAIRPCIFRYVYLWLDNGEQFWAWLVFVGSRSVAGWRWTGRRWIYFGVDIRRISSFACY